MQTFIKLNFDKKAKKKKGKSNPFKVNKLINKSRYRKINIEKHIENDLTNQG